MRASPFDSSSGIFYYSIGTCNAATYDIIGGVLYFYEWEYYYFCAIDGAIKNEAVES